ncbi:S8 family peptidase [Anaerolineales bacterium HSG25]|nr:S8 family peptidase [Anaerolineales bacterium HSG25]
MSATKLIAITVIGLLFIVWSGTLSLAQGYWPVQPPAEEAIFVPGEIIVKFKTGVSNRAGQRSLASIGLQTLEASVRWHLLRVAVPLGKEAETIDELLARGDIEFAEYNYYVRGTEEPNDPEFGRQWSLDNPDDYDIDAPEAWDVSTGSNRVIIAVLDTGIDSDHPDLEHKIVGGKNYIDDNADPEDDNGHGTHIAGIIAASTNNDTGMAGISWESRIMPLKVLDADQEGDTNKVAQAIQDAANTSGVKIINLSFAIPGSSYPCNSSAMQQAFEYADQKGVLIIAAAGNETVGDEIGEVNCPATRDEAIAVGSTDRLDKLAVSSNRGERLDVVAPGHRIYSTYLDGEYKYMSGTSMAAPHVAGLAALIWSYTPSLNHTEVRQIIQSTTDDLSSSDRAGQDDEFGWGRVNARQAVEYLAKPNVILTQQTFCVDDSTDGNIESATLTIKTANPEVRPWTATISPTVSWLSSSSPMSGTVSASSSAELTLLLAKPDDGPGTYQTTITIEADIAASRKEINIELLYTDICKEFVYIPVLLHK